MNVNINREDRGLDFKRIERIASMMANKTSNKIEALRKDERNIVKEAEKEAYVEFKLQADVEAIEEIENKIKKLKEDKEVHEKNIRKFCQPEDSRYGVYDAIREGSSMHEYIQSKVSDTALVKDRLISLTEEMTERLWLAKDIEEAIMIYDGFLEETERVIADGTTN